MQGGGNFGAAIAIDTRDEVLQAMAGGEDMQRIQAEISGIGVGGGAANG